MVCLLVRTWQIAAVTIPLGVSALNVALCWALPMDALSWGDLRWPGEREVRVKEATLHWVWAPQ